MWGLARVGWSLNILKDIKVTILNDEFLNSVHFHQGFGSVLVDVSKHIHVLGLENKFKIIQFLLYHLHITTIHCLIPDLKYKSSTVNVLEGDFGVYSSLVRVKRRGWWLDLDLTIEQQEMLFQRSKQSRLHKALSNFMLILLAPNLPLVQVNSEPLVRICMREKAFDQL